MIPKTIHYVWVGGADKPATIERCIKSWKKHLTDYEIIEWNESNFDMHQNAYIEQAYAQKKWAYVSDFMRAKVINEYGGIYLDTDVLVLDDLVRFLSDRAFVGFETPDYPFTAAFGAEAHHPLTGDMVHFYDDLNFEFDRENQMKNVNTSTVSDLLINKYGCRTNNQEQVLTDGIHVYPDTILCNPSSESSTIHVFNGSWIEGTPEWKKQFVKFMKIRLTSKKRAGLYQRLMRRA